MDSVRAVAADCLVSFLADLYGDPIAHIKRTRGSSVFLSFLDGLANAICRADIGRMDEGNEFHGGCNLGNGRAPEIMVYSFSPAQFSSFPDISMPRHGVKPHLSQPHASLTLWC